MVLMFLNSQFNSSLLKVCFCFLIFVFEKNKIQPFPLFSFKSIKEKLFSGVH